VTKGWPGKDTAGIFKNKGHIKRKAQRQQEQNRGKDNDLLTLGEGRSRQFSLLTHNALSGQPEKGKKGAPSVNLLLNDTACDARAGIPRRIGLVVVCLFVDHD
jgi:hypothetical protein